MPSFPPSTGGKNELTSSFQLGLQFLMGQAQRDEVFEHQPSSLSDIG